MQINDTLEDPQTLPPTTDLPLPFGVLGPLEVRGGVGPIHVGGPQIRAMLALLLARPGQVISLSTLVASLWSGDAPPSAERTARTYMSRLRLALAPLIGPAHPGPLIVTTPPGYLLRTDPASVDASLFERLALAGRQALTRNDPLVASRHLRNALRLWRGDAFAEFTDIPVLRAEASRLEELRLSAVENRLQSELHLGLGPDLVAELDGLVAVHPLRERLWVQFMTALYRSGRQAEALSAYQRARTLLADELGLEPSAELADTHRRILAQDPRLLLAVVGRSAPVATGPGPGRGAGRGRGLEAVDIQLAGRPEAAEPTGAAEPTEPTEPTEAAGPTEPIEPAEPAVPRCRPCSSRRLPDELRPGAVALAQALSQPQVRALVGDLGDGLAALGRGLAAFGRGLAALGRGLAALGRGATVLAAAVGTRVRVWSGWRAGRSLADMK